MTLTSSFALLTDPCLTALQDTQVVTNVLQRYTYFFPQTNLCLDTFSKSFLYYEEGLIFKAAGIVIEQRGILVRVKYAKI